MHLRQSLVESMLKINLAVSGFCQVPSEADLRGNGYER
jgi:hypothetical protein